MGKLKEVKDEATRRVVELPSKYFVLAGMGWRGDLPCVFQAFGSELTVNTEDDCSVSTP